MHDDGPHKDNWDKARSAAGTVSLVAVPLLVAIIGSTLNSSIKDAELRQRTVELAIAVLQEPPDIDEASRLREWAITVINQYSGVPLPEDAKKELQERALPYLSLSRAKELGIRGLLEEREGDP